MNILSAYKRTRFFLWVNVIGLAIGLAASIMLILFVVNELSYDRHFAGSDRVVCLNTAMDENGGIKYFSTNLGVAYSELPEKVTGIASAVRLFPSGETELIYETEHFQSVNLLHADATFFKVFPMKFVAGTAAESLDSPQSAVITRPYANIIFGNPEEATGKIIRIGGAEYTVSAVVEKLPTNTHFSFDVLTNIPPMFESSRGIDFYVYYRIKSGASLASVRSSIEKEYTTMLKPYSDRVGARAYGVTEKLTDIYLHAKAGNGLGKSNDMKFISLLTAIALFILMLAVTNFINLFMAQGETRMNEIGIRKTNGASISDIVRQFFSEVTGIVLIAFGCGFLLALAATPYLSGLIHKEIDLSQWMNPLFIFTLVVLLALTVVLSAAYPSFYLSRFNPLEILGKRLRFSKRKLTAAIVIFQSIVSIALVSYIFVINRQITYLENLPKNYNAENVMSVPVFASNALSENYMTLKQELLNTPGIRNASGGEATIGHRGSGQSVASPENRDKNLPINEYRVMPGLGELMEFQLTEGRFFTENRPENTWSVVLNESAVKMLELQAPVVGKHIYYRGESEIVGVVKDFIYAEPSNPVQPLMLSHWSNMRNPPLVYIRFDEQISRRQAEELVLNVFRKFDSEFYFNPVWSEDIYAEKFDKIQTQSRLALISTFLSALIAMLGLLAIHLYTAVRRTKEIGIRRINGATPQSLFSLLSYDVLKWIALSGIIATPVAWYIASDWLNNYRNHTPITWTMFALPVLIQCVIALITTSGVSLYVSSRNPVEALKTE
ncbi:MAG: ABC transporter permease [Dysgonamonadaceae bacterium]|jgi:putative ABC transport system permease protein|nr:ABC transporter permease [Dysgonamonadaceae bacterium]